MPNNNNNKKKMNRNHQGRGGSGSSSDGSNLPNVSVPGSKPTFLFEQFTSLPALRREIRTQLAANGTNVLLNDADATGDGDQSHLGHLTARQQQFYRDLFASGGDINLIADNMTTALSPFRVACLAGNVANVHGFLESTFQEVYETTPEIPTNLITLLETRDTSMRLSLLLMMISIGKNVSSAGAAGAGNEAKLRENQLQVVKLLLKYGARPDAKDVVGKTACHYGMGMMATDMTLQAADWCIEAAKSSHMYGLTVELHSLQNPNMNGKTGICKGYIADTGRRAVFLLDEQKLVGVKPENLKLAGEENDPSSLQKRPKLCDVPDRLGAVCLIEVIMRNRADVAALLLDEHHQADIDVTDVDGISPRKMAFTGGAGMMSTVATMINVYAAKQGRAENKKKKLAQQEQAQNKKNNDLQCSYCQTVVQDATLLRKCGRCRQVSYCGEECQRKHWKQGHKVECPTLAATAAAATTTTSTDNSTPNATKQDDEAASIVLEPPDTGGLHWGSFSFAKGSSSEHQFRKPDGVAPNEKFYIKIQGISEHVPLLIYDKTRQCHFHLAADKPGFAELFAKVKAETATNGTKTYMKASFDAHGKCTVYPNTTSLKAW